MRGVRRYPGSVQPELLPLHQVLPEGFKRVGDLLVYFLLGMLSKIALNSQEAGSAENSGRENQRKDKFGAESRSGHRPNCPMSGHKLVSCPVNGLEVKGIRGIFLDLLPQLHEMIVNGAR